MERLVARRAPAEDAPEEDDAIDARTARRGRARPPRARGPPPDARRTPSVRPIVRCGANGRVSSTRPHSPAAAVRPSARFARRSAPSATPTHRLRGRARLGNAPPPASATSKGASALANASAAASSGGRRSSRRRSEEAQRQVQPVDADPADPRRAVAHARPAPARSARRPAPGRPPGPGTAKNRRSDAGLVDRRHPAPAAATASALARSVIARSLIVPADCSRSHAARSWRRISSARAASRQPMTSTVLSSSSLYVLKKCSISTSRCGRICSSRSMWAWFGSPSATHRTLIVGALLVAHLEHADRARPDVAAGERRLVDEEQGVGVVAVVGARALDEAVIEVVEHRRRQHAIEAEDARVLVELVLVAAAARDLDDDLDPVRERSRRSSDGPRRELAGEPAIDRAVLGPPVDRVRDGLADRPEREAQVAGGARRVDRAALSRIHSIEPRSGSGARRPPARSFTRASAAMRPRRGRAAGGPAR